MIQKSKGIMIVLKGFRDKSERLVIIKLGNEEKYLSILIGIT